jgi:hypothetical protein
MNVMLVGSLTRRDVKSEVVLRPKAKEGSVLYRKATQSTKVEGWGRMKYASKRRITTIKTWTSVDLAISRGKH